MKARTEYKKWLAYKSLDPAMHEELLGIDGAELESRFGTQLQFGTAGLRGTIGAGPNRMYVYQVRRATQAMADLINAENGAEQGCAVCHDCRHFSREFAEAAAGVLAANGVKVRIFEDMRPTPELSFAIREYGCTAGINITASHNPKEYNGYKVYWSDGAQLPPEHAAKVAEVMARTDVFTGVKSMSFENAAASGMVTIMGAETDDKYVECVLSQSRRDEDTQRTLNGMKVVYTPFHGAGRILVPRVLRAIGVGEVDCVEKQMVPDGDFSTVVSPNPENPEGFYLAVELADKVGADLIVGTDPDSDRLGILEKVNGSFQPISGNRVGVLLADYILGAMTRSGTLPKNAAVLKTIVTTELARKVAESYGAYCEDTFTGFKFMAERIKEYEQTGEYSVVFSYEESYGYMPGTFVRDKDGVAASMLVTEMAAYHKSRGKSLNEALLEIFDKFGWYEEKTVNLMMPGLDGKEKMARMMDALRSEPPKEIAGMKVVYIWDFSDGTRLDTESGEREKIRLSGSNVLRFTLEDGTNFMVRPSGTEPKVKIYILSTAQEREQCLRTVNACEKYAKELEEKWK